VLQIIPFMIAGAFVPTWTSRVIILLATGKPTANGLAFVAGNFTYRLLLGLVVLHVADITVLEQLTRGGSTQPKTMFIAAFLLFSLAFWLWRQSAGQSDELPGWMKALERVHPAMSLAYGAFLVALPGVQYVYFIGALGVLFTQINGLAVQVVGLLIYCMFVQLMLLAPIVAFARYHDAAQPKLDAMKEWLTRHGNQVTAGLLCLFGVYALVIGAMAR
jgi:hypothetical protein